MKAKKLDAKSLGAGIRKLREARRLSQAELAVRLGISQQHVSKLELDIIEPRIGTVMKICEVLGTSVKDLLKGGREA